MAAPHPAAPKFLCSLPRRAVLWPVLLISYGIYAQSWPYDGRQYNLRQYDKVLPHRRAHHSAIFNTFCDSGSVELGNCRCNSGSDTAVIGDGSWLWHELVGEPCSAVDGDRCDCTSCGGAADDCPNFAAENNGVRQCWQCQGINPPQCSPSYDLKNCEVEVQCVHGVDLRVSPSFAHRA